MVALALPCAAPVWASVHENWCVYGENWPLSCKRGQIAREVEHQLSVGDIYNNSVGVRLYPLESSPSDPEQRPALYLFWNFLISTVQSSRHVRVQCCRLSFLLTANTSLKSNPPILKSHAYNCVICQCISSASKASLQSGNPLLSVSEC